MSQALTSVEAAPHTEKRKKILVVDDSRMVRASIVRNVRNSFDYREEADGESAWQALLTDSSIFMVITDIGMPRLDGYGLLDRIRNAKLAHIREMPVIVISGEEDLESRKRAKMMGASDFVTKGMGSSDLLARIDGLMKLASLKDNLFLQASQGHHQTHLGMPGTDSNWSRVERPSSVVDNAATMINLTNFIDSASDEDPRTALVFLIDQFEDLRSRLEPKGLDLLDRKLHKILLAETREDEGVEALTPGSAAILSPSDDVVGRSAFGLRMCHAIRKLVMAYGEERIRITVSIGVAGLEGMQNVTREHLIAIAQERALAAHRKGGNAVISESGEVTPEIFEELSKLPVSIDRMLILLRAGGARNVQKHFKEILPAIKPLMELIEEKYAMGLPLNRFKH